VNSSHIWSEDVEMEAVFRKVSRRVVHVLVIERLLRAGIPIVRRIPVADTHIPVRSWIFWRLQQQQNTSSIDFTSKNALVSLSPF